MVAETAHPDPYSPFMPGHMYYISQVPLDSCAM